MSVPLKFQREGIKYNNLNKEEKEEYETKFHDDETGQLLSAIDSAALNRWLFAQDAVNKVLEKLMEAGLG